MLNGSLEISSNIVVASSYYKMTLISREAAQAAKPGQFLHIRVSNALDPLLRRPMSIHSVEDEDKVSLLYSVSGPGTRLLAAGKAGDSVDVLGPLGQGFDLSDKIERAVLVAGGIGVAPLLFLAQKLKGAVRDIKVLAGAKNREGLLGVSELKDLGCDVRTTTEDGSAGRRGYITDIFEHALLDPGSGGAIKVYACGPRDMMARIATIAAIYNVSCEVSLEERMACGLGACMSCVTDTQDGLKRVCKDGPVFDAGKVKW